jgi:drug/metabolite transporter (DMT)-like permease
LLAYKDLFLFFVFFTALIISLLLLRNKREKIDRKDVLVGMAVGFFNLATNFVMIMALSQLKASIVFPITSAGAIITMSLGGWLFFREQLHRKEVIAIAMTVVALALINL